MAVLSSEGNISVGFIYQLGLNKNLNQKKGNKEYDKATALFENLLQSHPDQVAAHFHLGRLAVMSEKNLDKGEENLKKYLQTEPSDERRSFAFAHLLLGHIYRMQEKMELARNEYEQALKLDPDFEMARKAVKEL